MPAQNNRKELQSIKQKRRSSTEKWILINVMLKEKIQKSCDRIKNDCPLQCNRKHCNECQYKCENLVLVQRVVSTEISSPEYFQERYY